MSRLAKPAEIKSRENSHSVRKACRSAALSLALLSPASWVIVTGYCLYSMLLLDVARPGRSGETLAGLAAIAGVLLLSHALVLGARRRTLTALASVCDRAGEQLNQGGGDALRKALHCGGVVALIDAATLPLLIGGIALLAGWVAAIPLCGAVLSVIILMRAARRARGHSDAETARRTRDNATAIVLSDRQRLALLGMLDRAHTAVSMRRREVAFLDTVAARADWLAGAAISSIACLCFAGTAAAVTWVIVSDTASVGTFAATSLLAFLVFQPLRRVANRLPTLTFAWAEWRALLEAEAERPAVNTMVSLPAPAHEVVVSGLTVPVAGIRQLTLHDVTFNVKAGDLLAVIGPSAAGKSTLLKALGGQVPNASGTVRLDGAALNQWDSAALLQHIGYLPQLPGLLRGTVAQNIAGFARGNGEAVIRAAQVAGVHDDIVRLPQGYDTVIGDPVWPPLALSLQQRIALARALFGEPFVVLLDHPGSFQDNDGHLALRRCLARLRARGAVTIVAGDSASIIESANLVLVMRDGGVLEFGPKDDVRGRMAERQRREAERLANVSVFAEPRKTPADAPRVE